MENKYEDELSRAAVAYVVEPLPDTLEMERWANADALTRHTMCFIAGAAYAREHTSQLGDAYAQLLDDDQLLKLLPFINGAHEWMSGAKTIRDQYEADRKQTHAEIAALKAERTEMIRILKNTLSLAECADVTPSHEGSCGPDQLCDGQCADAASASRILDEAHTLLCTLKTTIP